MTTPDPSAWLQLRRGEAPLILSIPHSGRDIPHDIETKLVSKWLARKDTDWFVDSLYDFAAPLDVTIVRTALSRTTIDVNRDPSGASLYPGQVTTELCPTTTFDGEPLYRPGAEPDADQIKVRRERYFDPYHACLAAEITRLRALHQAVVLYEAHSIRSIMPRLFDGTLPHFNIGTNAGSSCNEKLTAAVNAICEGSGLSHIVNGRFKGGYTTRHYGQPREGIHAIQMELACRGYLREPAPPLSEANWPPPYDPEYARPMQTTLTHVLRACIDFARTSAPTRSS